MPALLRRDIRPGDDCLRFVTPSHASLTTIGSIHAAT
jgi:hypothetical protein